MGEKLRPLGDRVLILVARESEKTKGGIILTDRSRDTSGIAKGEVVAVGPGSRAFDGSLVPMGVKVGDTVYFNRQAQAQKQRDTDDDEDKVLVHESDLLAVIDGA